MKKSIAHQLSSGLKTAWKSNYFRTFMFLLVIGAFFRLYRLEGFVTFLGDQGRDALILKRIVMLEHFPAIGASSSVGGIFLGPFYYYFIAPWLLLFNFNPVGPAFGVAITSLFCIFGLYFCVKDLFNEKIALIFSFFMLFSEVLIENARYSWNPNLLPYFSLFFLYFLWKMIRTAIQTNEKKSALFKSTWNALLAGAFLAFSIQLHYVALALLLPTGIFVLYYFFQLRHTVRSALLQLAAFTSAFIFFSIPLIIFDLRHQFLNSKNFLALFTEEKMGGGSIIEEIQKTLLAVHNFAFNAENSLFISICILIGIATGVLILKKLNNNHIKKHLRAITYVFVSFLTILGLTSLFTEYKFAHYLGILFPLYYLLISMGLYLLVVTLERSKFPKMFLAFILLLFVYLQYSGYFFLSQHPNNQIESSKKIAKVIQSHLGKGTFQLTTIPDAYGDSTYRYFLEVWGRKALAKESIERAEQMFVMCEEQCEPIGNPQWDIALFAPTKIEGVWEAENVRIYKLTR